MTQDRLVTELKAEGLWNYVETLQPLGMEGVKMLLMQDYVRPPAAPLMTNLWHGVWSEQVRIFVATETGAGFWYRRSLAYWTWRTNSDCSG